MDELALIEQHIKENKPEQFIRNCICCAEATFIEVCEKGYYHLAKWMIERGNIIHSDKTASLLWAINNRHTEIVKLLLDSGADVNAEDNLLLCYAIETRDTEIVKVILDAGPDVHARDDYALRMAKFHGDTETVKLLEDWIEQRSE